MIVVADATPLIALARVSRLNLLQDVFNEIIIPDAVWLESLRQT
jgi:predicted nucleic acid-binding protein